MAGEGGVPVSKQYINTKGVLTVEIACQRQSAFAVQIDNTTGGIGGLVIEGRTHPHAEWLQVLKDDTDYLEPKDCGLMRFYWSSHSAGPSTVPDGGNVAVGFDCNYFHDVRITMGVEASKYSLYCYGY